jgi:hypothetical protein
MGDEEAFLFLARIHSAVFNAQKHISRELPPG